jgi:hypothetical protein
VIDLVRPRTPRQIALLAFTVLPSLGANLRVLKITGTHDVSVAPNVNEPMTLPRVLLEQIKDSCTGLRTFVIRKCRFDLEPGFQDHLPGTLETLEFNGCRWSNLYNFSSSCRIMSKITRVVNFKCISFISPYSVEIQVTLDDWRSGDAHGEPGHAKN